MSGAADSTPDRAAGASGRSTVGRRGLRVLLVDDHVLTRCRTRQQVEEIPFLQVVAEATDGLEAVALARTLSPDLVLMDISMPEMDGIEATRRITSEFPHIRVIMLSSYDDQSFQEGSKAAGAHGYVVKGASTSRLAEAIGVIFGRG